MELERHALVVCNKSMKVKCVVYAYGTGQLRLYALRSLKPSQIALLVDLTDGHVVTEYRGTNNGFPEVGSYDEPMYVDDSILQQLIRDDEVNKNETTTENH